MKFAKTLVAVAVLAATAAPAFATQAWNDYRFWDWDGAYVSAKGGYNWQQDNAQNGVGYDYKHGFMYTGALGYQAAEGVRAELEGGQQRDSLSKPNNNGRASATSIMANGYYDLNLAQLGILPGYANMLTPYVGAGIGTARVIFDDLGVDGNTTRGWELAYQGIAGAAINFTPNVSMTVEYRYFDTTNRNSLDVTSNNVLAGVKFKY